MPVNRKGLVVSSLSAAVIASGALAADERVVIRGANLLDAGVTPAHVSIDMRSVPAYPEWRPGIPIKEIPQRKGIPRDYVEPETAPQPRGPNHLRELNNLLGGLSGGPEFDTPIINRDGGGFTSVNPPDTIGDIGIDHFVQMINGSSALGGTRVLILDKTDGSTVADFALSSLAVGSGTGCTSGIGDPIVLFDQEVDNGPGQPRGRWLLTEFTSNSFCVYISQTADPTSGDWYIYEFGSTSGGLPDYPKWAAWPDAYYVGANEFASGGRANYAFDRENMLQGLTTRPTQVFGMPTLAGFGFQMAQPADWDGEVPPPPGAPGLFLRHRDDEVHNPGSADPTQDFLEIWEFSVDWDNPSNSTFTGPINIGVQDFESELCGLVSFSCVPQPGTGIRLDPLREPVMWRAQYRNFNGDQRIVASWVTDVVGGNADIHGVQWAELQNTGSGWTLRQEGVVSPDNVNRWMSTIAMDGAGNIALGYNVADATTFPGLRYIGRLATDPLNTMPRGEFSLIEGTASNSSNRYGDYASISVDPVDECTFWFTGQYNATSQWSTRIGAFRFDVCGEPGFSLSSPNAVGAVCTADDADDFVADIAVASVSDFDDPVTLSFDPPLASGFSSDFVPNPVIPGNSAVSTVTVQQSVSAGDYSLTVLGTAAGVDDRTLELLLTVDTALPGVPTQLAPADQGINLPRQPELEWTAVAQAADYLVEIATDPAFSNIVYDALVTGTSHQVSSPLSSSTEYFWRVTAGNSCGTGGVSDTFSFTTQPEPGDCPVGLSTLTVFSDDMEGGAPGWTLGAGSIQNTWELQSDQVNSGNFAWNAANLAEISDQRLVSPTINLPGISQLPLTLRFWNRQQIESATTGGGACWDAGILEISTDGGGSWTQLQDQILFREYDGIINTFSGGPNPLAGSPGWCGDPRDWEDYSVDLSDFAGQAINLRFRLGTDGTIGRDDGWSIDDVRVEACGSEVIFEDGFESPLPL